MSIPVHLITAPVIPSPIPVPLLLITALVIPSSISTHGPMLPVNYATYSEVSLIRNHLMKELDPRLGQDLRLNQDFFLPQIP